MKAKIVRSLLLVAMVLSVWASSVPVMAVDQSPDTDKNSGIYDFQGHLPYERGGRGGTSEYGSFLPFVYVFLLNWIFFDNFDTLVDTLCFFSTKQKAGKPFKIKAFQLF